MPTVFDKLNLKDQHEILVLNAPASFAGELKGLNNIRVVHSTRADPAVLYRDVQSMCPAKTNATSATTTSVATPRRRRCSGSAASKLFAML